MDCVDEGGGGRREEVLLTFFKPDIWPTLSFLKVSNPSKKEEEGAASKPASMFQMMNHIQSLISMAVENAKQEEKSISHQKSEFMFILATKSSKDRHLELLVYPFNRTEWCTMYNVHTTRQHLINHCEQWTQAGSVQLCSLKTPWVVFPLAICARPFASFTIAPRNWERINADCYIFSQYANRFNSDQRTIFQTM